MKNNLVARILTGLIAGSLAITVIVSSAYGFWLFCALISLLGLRELLKTGSVTDPLLTGVVLGWGVLVWVSQLPLLAGWDTSLPGPLFLALCWLPLAAITALFRPEISDPIRDLGVVALGLLYVYLPFHLFFHLASPGSEPEYQWQMALGILLLIWTLDTMAYFVGRWLGKRPLFPRVSPKKTWEGSVGGALFCLAVGFGLEQWMAEVTWNWVIAAAVVAVVAQLGDLVESMMKRSVNLKDSGNLLPGHGGILDRFDGFFLALPFLFLYWETW